MSMPETASAAAPQTNHTGSCFHCSICLDNVREPVVTQCGHLYCWPCLYEWLEPGMLPGERESLGDTAGARQSQLWDLTTSMLFSADAASARASHNSRRAIDESRRVCPVCKASCSVLTLVPIYALMDQPSMTTAATADASRNEENDQKPKASQHATASNNSSTQDTTPSSTAETISNDSDVTANSGTGLRQRRTSESSSTVPARPSAVRPQSERRNSNNHNNAIITTTPIQSTTTTPLGIANSFHSALMQRNPTSNTASYPSLHYRNANASPVDENAAVMAPPGASEYLSRILLLLGSFVLLCLLLF